MSKRNRGSKSLEYEVDSEWLDDDVETEAPSTESTGLSDPTPGRVVNAMRVNVRRCPAMKPGNEMTILNKGDEFEILGIVGDFCKVRLKDGRVGYIAYEFCQEV